MRAAATKARLTAPRRRLLELMQTVNFGRIERLSYVLTIVCGCRDWNIEPDDEVKAAMAVAQAATGRETYYEQSRAE